MSINQRKHIRFSLDIPATLISKFGERHETTLQQISIGGCFTDWEENVYTGDEFRLEIPLANGNKLPLRCKALYKFENTGVGVQFVEITQFEQDLIAKLIEKRLEDLGLSLDIDAFKRPSQFIEDDESPKITDLRESKDKMLEKIMSGEQG
jgi:hypothetical protein